MNDLPIGISVNKDGKFSLTCQMETTEYPQAVQAPYDVLLDDMLPEYCPKEAKHVLLFEDYDGTAHQDPLVLGTYFVCSEHAPEVYHEMKGHNTVLMTADINNVVDRSES